MKNNTSSKLLETLIANPRLFFEKGLTNDLLNEYFKGLSLDTLVPLLQSDDEYTLKSVVWIIAELSTHACSLLPSVVKLVDHENEYIRYYVLECILMCARGNYKKEFIHLIKAIEDKESSIRRLAMILLSNAEPMQIQTSISIITSENIKDSNLHLSGLNKLLDADSVNTIEILDMLKSDNPLVQRYGAMVARKIYDTNKEVLAYALSSDNADISEFARMTIE